jgi:Leucine-rich repeat (LRR) protein
MKDLLKIFFILPILVLFTCFESIPQTNKIDKVRRQKLDSIGQKQWESWYLAKQAKDSAIAQSKKEREAFRKTPLAQEYWETVRREDSIRHLGYVNLLDTISNSQHILKLIDGGFDAVPGEIYKLQKLDTLNLAGNQISSFNFMSENFMHLKYLDLYKNKLYHRHIRFDKNDTLLYLNLSNSELEKMPKSLRKLKGLTVLKIAENAPPDKKLKLKIGKWDSLKALDLSHNNLDKIPRRIRKLKHLEMLNLSYNNIKTLKGLKYLTQIKELEISFNPLFLDPKYIIELPSLERLIIRGCGITYLPPEINRFINLEKLVIPENRLQMVPPEIGDLRKLENLMLYKNQLDDLPDEIYNLTYLIWLDVYYNNLKYISPDISKLHNLEILYLSFNKIRELPESIGEMTNLKELYLHHNQLRELPESISNLKNLKYLHVYENHLTLFPHSVLELRNLEELNLSDNLIETFPMEIAQYQKLKYIYLDNNNTDKNSMSYEYFKWALKQLQDKGVLIRFDY